MRFWMGDEGRRRFPVEGMTDRKVTAKTWRAGLAWVAAHLCRDGSGVQSSRRPSMAWDMVTSSAHSMARSAGTLVAIFFSSALICKSRRRGLMKRLIAVVFLLGVSGCLLAQAGGEASEESRPDRRRLGLEEGILQKIENANVTAAGETFTAARKDPGAPVAMTFAHCQGLGVDRAEDQWWVLPISSTSAVDSRIEANHGLWILPVDAKSMDHSWYLELRGGKAGAAKTDTGLKVLINADSFTISKAEARPHSDPFGHRCAVKVAGGDGLDDALAGFYWGTMLPLMVE